MVSLELETGEIALTLRLLLDRLAEQIVFDAADERRSRQENLASDVMTDGITVSLPEGLRGGGRRHDDILRNGVLAGRRRIVDVDGAGVGVDRDECIRFDRRIDGGRVEGFDVRRRAGDENVVGGDVVDELLTGVRGRRNVLVIDDLNARRTCRGRKRRSEHDGHEGNQQRCNERRCIPIFLPIHGSFLLGAVFRLETALFKIPPSIGEQNERLEKEPPDVNATPALFFCKKLGIKNLGI